MNTTEQLNIINLCRAFIAKRPMLEPGNYFSDWRDASGRVVKIDTEGRAAYRSEARHITQQLNDARALLRYCELNGVDLNAQLTNRDRLHFDANGALEYHVGQYWPTEYRAAVARVASAAIWAYWRDQCNVNTGDKLRATARAEFGRGIASRWFN